MSLVDRERRYVAVNDATVALYGYPRADLLGSLAGRTAVHGEPSADQADWERLLRTGELFDERVVVDADGVALRVSFAAHATTVAGRWLALIVTLSAQAERDASELVDATGVSRRDDRGARLTRRERDVVRLLVLGATTSEVAAELVISADTVRSHVRNAMAKTGARTRAQLVALVLAQGLIDTSKSVRYHS
jgi:DNA-binding CsgD family transcriptional regulator